MDQKIELLKGKEQLISQTQVGTEAKIQTLDQNTELLKGKQQQISPTRIEVETEFEEHCNILSPLVNDQELYDVPVLLPQRQYAVSVIMSQEYDSLSDFDPYAINNNGADMESSNMIYEDFANHEVCIPSTLKLVV